MKRIIAASLIALLAVLLNVTATSTLQAGPGKGGQNQLKFEGVITVNLSTGKVTIRLQSGQSAVVQVVAATKVERNGAHVLLKAFKLGDRGQALTTSAGIATKIEAIGK